MTAHRYNFVKLLSIGLRYDSDSTSGDSFRIFPMCGRFGNVNSKVNIKNFSDHHTEELIFVQFYLLGLDSFSTIDEPSISTAQVRIHTLI